MWIQIFLLAGLIFNYSELDINSGKVVAPEKVATVYIFMSETCPICKSLTPEIKKIEAKYPRNEVEIVMVFPNISVSNESDIQKFKEKYKITSKAILDHNQLLTKQYGATITPEVFVIEYNTERIIYSGKVNDEFVGLGKRKRTKINHYLDSVLDDLTAGNISTITSTKAVGCFIIK